MTESFKTVLEALTIVNRLRPGAIAEGLVVGISQLYLAVLEALNYNNQWNLMVSQNGMFAYSYPSD